MAIDVPFEPVVHALREEVIDHFRSHGEPLDSDAGRRTLDTNSTLAASRADMLVAPYLRRSGRSDLRGLRIVDFGCGFGAVSLALATHGARVVGLDPNEERMGVSARLAARFGLDARFQRGTFQRPDLPAEDCDLVVVNNALCYVIDSSERRLALANLRDLLRPGGWIVVRDPNRAHPHDVFTGLPLVHRLPARTTARVAASVSLNRSAVRLTTPREARRELRRAGFQDVRFDGSGSGHRWLGRVAGYHHTSARKPAAT